MPMDLGIPLISSYSVDTHKSLLRYLHRDIHFGYEGKGTIVHP